MKRLTIDGRMIDGAKLRAEKEVHRYSELDLSGFNPIVAFGSVFGVIFTVLGILAR